MTINKKKVRIYFKAFFSTTLIFCSGVSASYAQVNAFNAQFYQNQYLANPAMAGVMKGTNINLGIRDRLRNVEGAPNSQSLTADMGFKGNSGVGINLSQTTQNILSQTKVAATYAYHLPINEESKVHFGISAGVISQKLNFSKIIGNANDVMLAQYNDSKPVFDADFGLAYTFKALTLQAVVYNGIQQLDENSNALDLNKFYGAAEYQFNRKGFGLTPKVAYRKIASFDDLFDAGLELGAFDNDFRLSGIYHSNNSFSAGLSYRFISSIQFLMMFNSQSSSSKNYSPEEFELGLKLNLGKIK